MRLETQSHCHTENENLWLHDPGGVWSAPKSKSANDRTNPQYRGSNARSLP